MTSHSSPQTSLQNWLASPSGLQALRTELSRRRLIDFTTYTFPQYQPGPVHRYVAAKLEAVERGDIQRLMIFLPPRTGKTELLMRWLAWCVGRHPNWPMLYTSYGADLSWEKSGEVRNIVGGREFGEVFGRFSTVAEPVELAKDNRSVQRWRIAGHRGGLQAQGVGGPITGKGGMLIVVDDPVKNREEADSATIRKKVWDWYTSTLRTRLETGGRIVLVMTRWHEDDLAGRLLRHARENPEADQFEVISMPAIAATQEERDAAARRVGLPLGRPDPLGRAPGEPLDPGRYPLEALKQIRASVGSRDWSALYGQEPRPDEGNIFKKSWFRTVERLPVCRKQAVVWDTAYESKQQSDYSAAALTAQGADGNYYVLPLLRERLEFPELLRAAQELVKRWAGAEHLVEARASGKSLRQSLRANGVPLIEIEPEGDKVARAHTVTKYFEAGMVYFVGSPLLDEMEQELLGFPNAAHDDLVDVVAYGLRRLGDGGGQVAAGQGRVVSAGSLFG